MLGMRLEVSLRQTQKLELLQIRGGITESVFVKTEAKLMRHTKYQKALRFLAGKERMAKYRSVPDFLFCESFPQWKVHCFQYYAGKGCQLRGQTSKARINAYDIVLCDLVLEALLALSKEFETNRWGDVVKVVRKCIAQAA